jgi:hypothetical protein
MPTVCVRSSFRLYSLPRGCAPLSRLGVGFTKLVGSALQAYLGVRLPHTHACSESATFCLRVLPMGWRWSPVIAPAVTWRINPTHTT